MKKYVIYSHAGSANHGCEALLRTTLEVIKDVDKVYSNDVSADEMYGLDTIVNLKEAQDYSANGFFKELFYKIKYKILKDDKIYFRKLYKKMIDEIAPEQIYVSIGGDNYCYHFSEWLEVLNTEINKKGAKTVLWGCSINSDELEDAAVLKDLSKYSLITVRETLTYDLLKRKLPESKIYYVPDTAFILQKDDVEVPNGFVEKKTVGINVSPVILNSAKNSRELYNGFLALINYIIDNTNYQVALIPHVTFDGNDDREILSELYAECKDKKRVVLIGDASCAELKGYISKCNMFIGARTHATIAAYSSNIPTVVIGYSIKSMGIAKDLFGEYEKYVLPVQKIENQNELICAFKWLDRNQNNIREHLKKIMPEYISRIEKAKEYLKEI